jgi:hypothetical protein
MLIKIGKMQYIQVFAYQFIHIKHKSQKLEYHKFKANNTIT